MKEIVAAMLLLAAVLFIYESALGGSDGTGVQVRNGGGGRIQSSIERLDP